MECDLVDLVGESILIGQNLLGPLRDLMDDSFSILSSALELYFTSWDNIPSLTGLTISSVSSWMPSPFTAAVGMTGTPRISQSFLASIEMPLFSMWSIWFRAMITGALSSRS